MLYLTCMTCLPAGLPSRQHQQPLPLHQQQHQGEGVLLAHDAAKQLRGHIARSSVTAAAEGLGCVAKDTGMQGVPGVNLVVQMTDKGNYTAWAAAHSKDLQQLLP